MIRYLLLPVALVLLLGAADDPARPTLRQTGAARWFAGLVLTDQNGERVRLYEDLMEGHVVVVNAFFAGCRAACPQVMGTLSHLQAQSAIDGILANFISITIDPEHDTANALNLYARSLGADASWRMLSGDPATVRLALHRFGLDANPNDPSDHLNILYMANLRTGLWKKVLSLAPLEHLEALLQQVQNDPGQ